MQKENPGAGRKSLLFLIHNSDSSRRLEVSLFPLYPEFTI